MAAYPNYPQGSNRLPLTMLLNSNPPPLAPPPPQPPQHSSQSAFRRRGNCTMAMLLGDDNLDTRCRYPSKLCRNTRVRKPSGALHRYCAYHRSKANNNQKRWIGRQHDAAESPSASSSCSSEASSPTTMPQTKYHWMLATAAAQETSTDKMDYLQMATRATDEPPCQGGNTTEGGGVATLSEDDWDSLLSLLRPTNSHEPSHARPPSEVYPWKDRGTGR